MNTVADILGKNVRYRLIYLSLNEYSDERLAAGLLLEDGLDVTSYFVGAQYAKDALSGLFGAEFLQSYEFGTSYLRDAVRARQLAFDAQGTLLGFFSLGSILTASCNDANKFARDVLEMSSSLYRSSPFSRRETRYLSQKDSVTRLYDALSLKNPLLATRLFTGRTVAIETKRFHLPIFGERIMGSPLSLVTKMIEDAIVKGESLFARFNFLRKTYDNVPAIYALLPAPGSDANFKAITRAARELETVAEANGVAIRKSDSPEELANMLERDELAME